MSLHRYTPPDALSANRPKPRVPMSGEERFLVIAIGLVLTLVVLSIAAAALLVVKLAEWVL